MGSRLAGADASSSAFREHPRDLTQVAAGWCVRLQVPRISHRIYLPASAQYLVSGELSINTIMLLTCSAELSEPERAIRRVVANRSRARR